MGAIYVDDHKPSPIAHKQNKTDEEGMQKGEGEEVSWQLEVSLGMQVGAGDGDGFGR